MAASHQHSVHGAWMNVPANGGSSAGYLGNSGNGRRVHVSRAVSAERGDDRLMATCPTSHPFARSPGGDTSITPGCQVGPFSSAGELRPRLGTARAIRRRAVRRTLGRIRSGVSCGGERDHKGTREATRTESADTGCNARFRPRDEAQLLTAAGSTVHRQKIPSRSGKSGTGDTVAFLVRCLHPHRERNCFPFLRGHTHILCFESPGV